MNAMEIDRQYETAENACVTTMRSQQLSSPAPPSEELRQTGLNTAVALVNAAPADLSLRDLDDVTLDHEIAEQEGLVASNPSMAKYMQLSLQLHQAERQLELDPEDHPLMKVRWGNPVVSGTCVLPPHESADRKALFYSRDQELSNRASVALEKSLVRCERRNVALVPALLAVAQSTVAPTGAAGAAQAAEGMQVAMVQPAAEAAAEAAPAGPRLRKRVVRFGEDDRAATAEPEAVTGMRDHLKFMRKAIKENAKWLRCPLLGVQMQHVALASDGHFYDLRAIQTHIRANLGRPMVSPITKRSMLMSVHHMQKGKKTLWTPELCDNPPPAVCDTRVAVVPPSPSA